MSTKLGMNPDRVLDAIARLTAQAASLDNAVATVEQAARASLNPVSYGIQPGGLIIAPWAIAGTQVAAMMVRQAASDAEALASRLITEVVQQQLASASDGASALRDRSLAQSIYRAALADPAVLDGMTPAERAAWWSSLSEPQRERLIDKYPLLIGNAEGLPYGDRDAANRLALDRMLDDPSTTDAQRRALEQIRNALAEAEKRGEPAQLVLLDFPEGADPRAAIAYGDLDTADYVGVLVPGMDNTVEKDMTKLSTGAYNLYLEQQQILKKAGSDEGVAVIAWTGYQTPGALPNLSVLGEGRAVDGAPYLTSTLSGLDAALGQDPRVTVFAHSYGTRTATYSLSTGGSSDALVMFGSPGIAEPVTSVDDLDVAPGEVWVSRADKDDVAPKGLFGSGNLDPLDSSFGAEHFSSDGATGRDGVDGHGLLLAEDSNGKDQGYLDRGTDSLHDMALLGLGREGSVR